MSDRFSAALLAGTLVIASVALAATAGMQVPPTLADDPAVPRVVLNGHAFHSEQFGDARKPVVIVLHGGPGADYRYLLGLKALSDAHHVVFYDQRGTGLSARVPAETLSVQSFIDDLDAFVDRFGAGRPVHLVGHSWGAMLAAAYAGAHPRKVDKIVLAEPAFLLASEAETLGMKKLPPLRVMWGFTAAWFAKWLVRTQGDPHAREDWFMMQVLPLTQHPHELCDGRLPPLQAWRFGSANFEATVGRMLGDERFARQLDFRRGVENFRGQALFLAGACNQLGGQAQQRRLMAHFGRARLEVIPDAGHFMFNDQPERSVAAVRAFLSGAP